MLTQFKLIKDLIKDTPTLYMVYLIFAISDMTMSPPNLSDTPQIKTCFTNIQSLQFITTAPQITNFRWTSDPLYFLEHPYN